MIEANQIFWTYQIYFCGYALVTKVLDKTVKSEFIIFCNNNVQKVEFGWYLNHKILRAAWKIAHWNVHGELKMIESCMTTDRIGDDDNADILFRATVVAIDVHQLKHSATDRAL